MCDPKIVQAIERSLAPLFFFDSFLQYLPSNYERYCRKLSYLCEKYLYKFDLLSVFAIKNRGSIVYVRQWLKPITFTAKKNNRSPYIAKYP